MTRLNYGATTVGLISARLSLLSLCLCLMRHNITLRKIREIVLREMTLPNTAQQQLQKNRKLQSLLYCTTHNSFFIMKKFESRANLSAVYLLTQATHTLMGICGGIFGYILFTRWWVCVRPHQIHFDFYDFIRFVDRTKGPFKLNHPFDVLNNRGNAVSSHEIIINILAPHSKRINEIILTAPAFIFFFSSSLCFYLFPRCNIGFWIEKCFIRRNTSKYFSRIPPQTATQNYEKNLDS